MATLILGPKTFAASMRSIYGSGSLKINRVITAALRKGGNMVINLDEKSADAIATTIHLAETLNGRPSPFNDAAITGPTVGMPALQYSLHEWKSLVETLNETKSTIIPDSTYGVVNVHLDIAQWRNLLDPVFKVLLAKGTKGRTGHA